MPSELRYDPPLRLPAVVTDRWGRVDTVLVNDGQTFSLLLRGNRFEGSSLDALELAGRLDEDGLPPDLTRLDELCSCTIEWSTPLQVAGPDGGRLPATLHGRVVLGDPGPSGGLDALHVTLRLDLPDGGTVETAAPWEDMEDALLDLRRQLPPGVRILACITCAHSDYSPAGSGFMGSMACFRDSKDTYRTVSGKPGLLAIWDHRTGFTQETFHCPEFEPRRPGTGYRG
ncbi:DUF6304 family protein [Kitasatospora aureofaciens]|uniref:DUF6304 family protein n=1 Tax=Kitasatospora aureofaciens TaxID=1894 RepID=UPI001C466CA1|nr:DUF6304 family protein [Kitasatospora aureofaciens]MBV6697778.1 hypothetical protein [Kitasatospora aureofaciens]